MKVAAIVICYHPDELGLYKNIKAFVNGVDKVIVWRNSEVNFSYFAEWGEKILFMGDGKNEYIAKPLNIAINWCYENKYDFLLTMDQDSEWLNFELFISQIQVSEKHAIAIHSPNVNHCYQTTNPLLYVESVITSGSLMNVDIAKHLGGVREDYKIYWVDGEFCFWARKKGYKIVAYPHSHLRHELGKQTKTICGYDTSNYSPIVYYYIFRNMLWMSREHGNMAVSKKCILYTSFYHIRGIVLGEKQKSAKLMKIIIAFVHGVFKRIPSQRVRKS